MIFSTFPVVFRRSALIVNAMVFVALSASSAPVNHNISAGLLDVELTHPYDTNLADVSVVREVNNFECYSANRGDFSVRVGTGYSSALDVTSGILMTCIAENGRNNFGTTVYAISSITPNVGGTWRIVTFSGGTTEYNVNVAGAYFPFDKYLGARVFNAADVNGATNDTLVGSSQLVLGTHFRWTANGQFVVDLTSLGINSQTDGILLANHATEEDNFAMAQARSDGAWNLYVRDNGETSSTAYEQDHVAFVFVPKTNTSVISGRFLANGTAEAFSGASPQFTVTPLAVGRWRLEINGGSPTNGVLVISPEGGRSINRDNIVNYQPTAGNDAWEIESRDTPGNTLENPTGEPVASFVYVPAGTPGISATPTNGLSVTGPDTSTAFNVSLHCRPAANVTIPVTSTDPGKGVPDVASITFTPGSWSAPQMVKVIGRNNTPSPTNTTFAILLGASSSSDPAYNGINPADVTIQFVPPRAAYVAPTNGNKTTGISPVLKVAVTNGSPGNLNVEVYGRENTAPLPGPDFTIAVLPDTQMYTGELNGGTKEMIIAQTEWCITNRVSRNIAYVTQLGDLVNNGDYFATTGLPNTNQWWNATNAMYRLENPVRTQLPHGMPYGIAVGNHEFSPIGNPTNGTTMYYNQYFGVDRFQGRSYYAGHWSTNNNNHYDFFSASGLDFVVVYFEYNPAPQPELLEWANDILRTNANRRAIVVTHNMGNTQTPVNVSEQWMAIYNALKTNSNLFLMLAGHVTGQGSRVDTHQGRNVYTFVQDYQGWQNGGEGFMRLYEFSPSNNVVVIQTFSPYTGEWLTDELSELYFPYQMQPEPPAPNVWTTLGSTNSVAPGSVVNVVWPGLQANKRYEWYVRVTDSQGGATISPIWGFATTTNNSAPIVIAKALSIQGDSSTNVVLTATDANSDVLTYQIVSAPAHGILQDFNAASGTLTYVPARGYRGPDAFTVAASDSKAVSTPAAIDLTMLAPADTNANGLPDAWESAYGVTDPDGDSDGDGMRNLAEFLAATNPTNALSVLRIMSAEPIENGGLQIAWPSVGGVRYRVQFSNGPGVNRAFQDVVRDVSVEMGTNAVGVTGVQGFVDDLSLTGAPTNHARYYRVRVAQ